MMGQKSFSLKLFHALIPFKLVPEGHLIRRLEKVLDLKMRAQVLCTVLFAYGTLRWTLW